MPYRTTQAMVLRRSDYRDNDRILTLFSPELGRVDALCRGCRKPKSPLMAASELFTLGEFVLFTGKGKEMVQSCGIIEGFYPLRLDYGLLSHASMMAAACLKVIQPEEPMGHLFILLARSLKRLAYEQGDPDAVSSAFLLHFVTLQGLKPRLNHCVHCGKVLGEEAGYLNEEDDGVSCLACGKGSPGRAYLNAGQLHWLRQVLAHGIDKAEALEGTAPVMVMKRYIEARLESGLPKLRDD